MQMNGDLFSMLQPALAPQQGRRAGRGVSVEHPAIPDALADGLRGVAELARLQLDEHRGQRGTLKGITREDEDVVFMARFCNQHDVAVGQDAVGKNLFRALKDAATGAGALLRDCGFEQPMRNRLALGIAGAWWGGRSHVLAEKWALG
eukprot:943188-Amphidinium_carterae.1